MVWVVGCKGLVIFTVTNNKCRRVVLYGYFKFGTNIGNINIYEKNILNETQLIIVPLTSLAFEKMKNPLIIIK